MKQEMTDVSVTEWQRNILVFFEKALTNVCDQRLHATKAGGDAI